MMTTMEALSWALAMAVACCCSALLQRGHLFVWSVFGPLVAWQCVFVTVAWMEHVVRRVIAGTRRTK